MRFSVLIPTIGRREPLRETLNSLLASDPPPAEVVVVDSHEHGAARKVVDEVAARTPWTAFRYVRSGRGASLQRQVCLESASGDVVVFIDDDALVDRRLFAVLAQAYRDPEVVGATGRVLQDSYRSYGNQQSLIRRLLFAGGQGMMSAYGYPQHLQDLSTVRDVEFMQGCLMSARRSEALQVSFDLTLGGPRGVALLEDEDFSYRLSRLGRVRFLPDAVVHHLALGFHGRDAREYSRLILRDRAYLLHRNFRPTPFKLMQFGLLIAMLFAHRVVNREWRGVLGLLDGLAQARREGLLRPVPGAAPGAEEGARPLRRPPSRDRRRAPAGVR